MTSALHSRPSPHLALIFLIKRYSCTFHLLFEGAREAGFLRVTALTVLGLIPVDQAGLELTEIPLPLLPRCLD